MFIIKCFIFENPPSETKAQNNEVQPTPRKSVLKTDTKE